MEVAVIQENIVTENICMRVYTIQKSFQLTFSVENNNVIDMKIDSIETVRHQKCVVWFQFYSQIDNQIVNKWDFQSSYSGFQGLYHVFDCGDFFHYKVKEQGLLPYILNVDYENFKSYCNLLIERYCKEEITILDFIEGILFKVESFFDQQYMRNSNINHIIKEFCEK